MAGLTFPLMTQRLALMCLVLVVASATTGCASSRGPEFITIDAAEYAHAFDVAMDATSDEGFALVLRDRRGGVIETDPVIAESLLEPWRTSEASFSDTLNNTLNLQRRRARIEFRPATFAEGDSSDPMQGPDLLAMDEPPLDLTQGVSGPMEIRAWVWIERAYVPGRRRFTWSRSSTSTVKVIDAETGETVPARHWTPVARDEAYERVLLSRIQERLNPSS